MAFQGSSYYPQFGSPLSSQIKQDLNEGRVFEKPMLFKCEILRKMRLCYV